MLQQNTTRRIGYWLLHLHQLFDASTNRTLAPQGLTRRHWQVLHALHIGVDTIEDIDTAFAPFLIADGIDSYASIVADFDDRGWISVNGTRFSLTDAGAAAHEKAEEQVEAHAEVQLKGISETEFLAANDVLARIAANVEENPWTRQ
ncbi:MarR family winged helix-turn-helix transcriptional regulator [Streptomyces acidiscabies]|uniref:MarR family winged helix-turn-helix transcriptional regulator n=1 Tax=Streptomyces acidiscabies TaxID=42234 RepID=UPI0038F60DC0